LEIDVFVDLMFTKAAGNGLGLNKDVPVFSTDMGSSEAGRRSR
jgi:hypothetical protein